MEEFPHLNSLPVGETSSIKLGLSSIAYLRENHKGDTHLLDVSNAMFSFRH